MLEKPYCFPKSRRLLSPKDFKRVYSCAKRISNNNIAMSVRSNNQGFARIGFSFTRKKVKLSVNRSKLKRISRESFRLNQHDLPAVDIIIMAKLTIDRVDNDEINHSLEKLWVKLNNTFSDG